MEEKKMVYIRNRKGTERMRRKREEKDGRKRWKKKTADICQRMRRKMRDGGKMMAGFARERKTKKEKRGDKKKEENMADIRKIKEEKRMRREI